MKPGVPKRAVIGVGCFSSLRRQHSWIDEPLNIQLEKVDKPSMARRVHDDVCGLHVPVKNRSHFKAQLIKVGGLVRRTQGRRDLAEHGESQPVPVYGCLRAATPYLEGDAVNQIHREVGSCRSSEVEHSVIVSAYNVRMVDGRDCSKAPREERKEVGVWSAKGIEQFEGKWIWIAAATYTIDDAASASTQVGLNHVGSDTGPGLWGGGLPETAASS
jgi:hypothetical protein